MWARAAQVNTQLPFCDAVFWIQVTTTMIKLNIGNSYWGAHPEERKHTENDVDTLIAHVLSFPKDEGVILLGDFNADSLASSHNKRGALFVLLKKLLKKTGLVILPRPHTFSCTRPTAGTHVDLFLVSRNVLPLLKLPVQYYTSSNIGVSSGRTPSDHIPLSISLGNALRPRATYTKHIRWALEMERQNTMLLPYVLYLMCGSDCATRLWHNAAPQLVQPSLHFGYL